MLLLFVYQFSGQTMYLHYSLCVCVCVCVCACVSICVCVCELCPLHCIFLFSITNNYRYPMALILISLVPTLWPHSQTELPLYRLSSPSGTTQCLRGMKPSSFKSRGPGLVLKWDHRVPWHWSSELVMSHTELSSFDPVSENNCCKEIFAISVIIPFSFSASYIVISCN